VKDQTGEEGERFFRSGLCKLLTQAEEIGEKRDERDTRGRRANGSRFGQTWGKVDWGDKVGGGEQKERIADSPKPRRVIKREK